MRTRSLLARLGHARAGLILTGACLLLAACSTTETTEVKEPIVEITSTDVAVEVVSPNDLFADVEGKAFSWLDCGTRLVLIVEPESETVHAYRSRSNITVLRSGEALDAADVVAGWSVQITDIFA